MLFQLENFPLPFSGLDSLQELYTVGLFVPRHSASIYAVLPGNWQLGPHFTVAMKPLESYCVRKNGLA